MTLKWHRRARQDLVKVRAYIARQNPKAAAEVAKPNP
jgi:plasmid stabilization system protein ParE